MAESTHIVLAVKSPYKSTIVAGYEPISKPIIAGEILPSAQVTVYGGVPPVIDIEALPSDALYDDGLITSHSTVIGNIVITSHSFD